MQVQVLHIVQEALSNVRKHAHATQVVLEVRKGEAWRIVVRDDGQGFSMGVRPRQSTHVGMRIMQERAQRIGALVQVQTDPEQGTSVVLTLPAHPVSGVNQGTMQLDAAEWSAVHRAADEAARTSADNT